MMCSCMHGWLCSLHWSGISIYYSTHVHSNLCIETKATASLRMRTLPLPALTLVALGEDVVEQILSVSSKHLKCEQRLTFSVIVFCLVE